jgi:DnaJ-class molecular chaperone
LDYYSILRVAPNASRKEIEQAYQRLLKESRYDTSIDRHEIENAYKVLTDLEAKSQYDTRQTMRAQRTVRIEKRKRRELGLINWIKNLTLRQLLVALGISLSMMISFYTFRFGHLLTEFQAGDVLYEKSTHQHFGKVLKVELKHDFGSKQIDAYQMELDPAIVEQTIADEKIVWLPQNIVKARCYKKSNKQ